MQLMRSPHARTHARTDLSVFFTNCLPSRGAMTFATCVVILGRTGVDHHGYRRQGDSRSDGQPQQSVGESTAQQNSSIMLCHVTIFHYYYVGTLFPFRHPVLAGALGHINYLVGRGRKRREEERIADIIYIIYNI